MSRRWVLDSSPIIVLAETGQADLFIELAAELTVPEAVKEEIDRGEENDPARLWLQGEGQPFVRPVEGIPAVSAWDLGSGESAVLSWAKDNPDWEAIADDRAARNCAEALGVPVRGTVGVILLAKREGLIRHAQPLLEDVTEAGLYVSEGLFEMVLRLAEED